MFKLLELLSSCGFIETDYLSSIFNVRVWELCSTVFTSGDVCPYASFCSQMQLVSIFINVQITIVRLQTCQRWHKTTIHECHDSKCTAHCLVELEMLVHQLDEDARKCHGVARPPKERKIENIRPPSHSFMKQTDVMNVWKFGLKLCCVWMETRLYYRQLWMREGRRRKTANLIVISDPVYIQH